VGKSWQGAEGSLVRFHRDLGPENVREGNESGQEVARRRVQGGERKTRKEGQRGALSDASPEKRNSPPSAVPTGRQQERRRMGEHLGKRNRRGLIKTG
jgi:hypothetical protein